MSTTTSSPSSAGPSLATLLTVLFVALKLTHKIDWSWWWVLSPLWIGLAIVIAIVAIGALIVALFDRGR